MTLILVFGLTIWHTARVIERSDAARRAAEHDRDLLIASERQARADAERSNRLKDQFLATLSHELRTPLNVMLGWTQILERGVNPAENARIAGVVARNGRLLARLVGDLLDISRVTTAQFEIFRSPIVLNDIVAASIDEIRPLADEKGIRMSAELAAPPEPIEADGERLQQIVWNLLSNAVKFTGPGGHMMIRTSAASDAVCLSVTDTGIGFDQAFASELFKPFRQADSSVSREHGGLGLGLSIAKHLAELHGGSLAASSGGLGKGATFTLQLPRMPRSASAAAAPESVSAGHHSLT
jgi:signal transduction histidine kinase